MNKAQWFDKFPGKNIDMMIMCFLSVVEGMCGLLTLGYWSPTLLSKYVWWTIRKKYEITS